MDTWAIQSATHASLTSGQYVASIPVIGAGQTNFFALGAGLAVLAFAATRISRQLDPVWRPGGFQSPARWSRACQRRVRRLFGIVDERKFRSTERVDRVLGGPADEIQPNSEPQHPSADEIFWPPSRSTQASPGGYQSKHRLPGPARPSQRYGRSPRHAASPAKSSAR
jgi:hypothetical protein